MQPKTTPLHPIHRACSGLEIDCPHSPLLTHTRARAYTTREQLVKEYDAMPTKAGAGEELPASPWGIISVKAQVGPGGGLGCHPVARFPLCTWDRKR